MKTLKKLLAAVLALTLVLTMTPSMAFQAQAASKSVTVSTQSGLKAALKNTKVTSITIKTSKTKTFTIGSGTYTKKALTISAPKATINNSGKFKSVTIKDATKFTEKAKNNVLKVTDSKLSMVVSSTASVKSLTFSKKSGTLTLTNNGKISAVSVTAKSTLTMKGSASKNTKVSIGKNAAGTKLTSSIGLTLTVGSNATINLLRGAGTTKITLSSKDITAKVSNKTLAAITIKRADGTTETVKAGKSSSVTGTKPSDTSDTDNTDEGNKDDTNTDDTNKDDNNTDDTDKDDSNKDDNNSGGGSGGGGFIGGGGGGSSSNSTARTFASAIASAQDGSEVTLSYDVTGDVTATWNGSGTLTIAFGTHKINGSLSITAPNATEITLADSGSDDSGAVISGNLTVNAPSAHVVNFVKVNGSVNVEAVASSTFVLCDSASTLEVWGKGKISFMDGLNEVPQVSIKTDSPVILDGGIQAVTVEKAGANLSITDGTTIEKVEISSSASITGDGSISELNVSAPVSIGTNVDQVSIASKDAEIKVEENKTVSTIVVQEGVSEVNISGKGAVTALDLSQISLNDNATFKINVANDTTAPVVIASAETAEKIKEQNSTLTVVYVTKVELEYKGETELPVNEYIDLSYAWITVTYSDDSTKDLPVTAGMFNNYTLKEPGKSEMYVTYAGVNSNPVELTYKKIDTVTLKCSAGTCSTIIAPEGFLIDRYSVGDSIFNDISSYIEATSNENLQIKYSYKSYYVSGSNFTEGLPTEAGSYTIMAESLGTDECFGNSDLIFLVIAEDYLTIDYDKASKYESEGIIWEEYSYPYYTTAYIEFESYATFSLKEMIEDVITSANGYELKYSYCAGGCQDWKYVYTGLPTVPGEWNIYVSTAGADFSNGNVILLFVYTVGAEYLDISATFSGAAVSGAAITGSAITGSSITVTSYQGYCNTPVYLLANEDFTVSFSCNGQNIIDDIYIYRIIAFQETEYGDYIDEMEEIEGGLSGISKNLGKGYYWIWVRAEGTDTIQETWALFKVHIE